jgi:hypothetical protein
MCLYVCARTRVGVGVCVCVCVCEREREEGVREGGLKADAKN